MKSRQACKIVRMGGAPTVRTDAATGVTEIPKPQLPGTKRLFTVLGEWSAEMIAHAAIREVGVGDV